MAILAAFILVVLTETCTAKKIFVPPFGDFSITCERGSNYLKVFQGKRLVDKRQVCYQGNKKWFYVDKNNDNSYYGADECTFTFSSVTEMYHQELDYPETKPFSELTFICDKNPSVKYNVVVGNMYMPHLEISLFLVFLVTFLKSWKIKLGLLGFLFYFNVTYLTQIIISPINISKTKLLINGVDVSHTQETIYYSLNSNITFSSNQPISIGMKTALTQQNKLVTAINFINENELFNCGPNCYVNGSVKSISLTNFHHFQLKNSLHPFVCIFFWYGEHSYKLELENYSSVLVYPKYSS
jgi:hypothetical protein